MSDDISNLIQNLFKESQDLLLSVTIPNCSGMGDEKFFLLNPYLERIIFFYKLVTKSFVEFYFNTKSHFYNFEEYLIDRVEKYKNEWYLS